LMDQIDRYNATGQYLNLLQYEHGIYYSMESTNYCAL
jgi:hypothetical protein